MAANKFHFSLNRWHNSPVASASIVGTPVLRQKLCGNPDCRAMFTVCVSCDRGQRYCRPTCRATMRRHQRRQANRRYQLSESGREAHRRCQRRYRGREPEPSVTDQAVPTITSSLAIPLPALCRCTVCGRQSAWFDPYPPIPRRFRSARRSKNYVFS